MALIDQGVNVAQELAPRPSGRFRRATDLGPDTALSHRDDYYAICDIPEVLQREARFRRPLIAADAIAAALAVFVAALISGTAPAGPSAALAIPLVVLLAKLHGLYERDAVLVHKSTLDEIPSIFHLGALATLALWLLEAPLDAGISSRVGLVALFVCLMTGLVAGRAIARLAARRTVPQERCLLVGDIGLHDRLASRLKARNAEIVGSLPLADRRAPRAGHAAQDPCASLKTVIERLGAHRVIVAPGDADQDLVFTVVSRAKAAGVHVSILPRLLEAVGSSVAFDELDGLVMLGVNRFGLPRSSRVVKRATDVAGALAALCFAAPVMALIAILIKWDSPGPVLFRQRRVGRNGHQFEMVKFRSMYVGAESQRVTLAELNDAGDGLFKVAADPRVTRVGRLLRRYSLDELPQLFNVLRGEMSLVGPRPLVVDEDKQVEGWHRRRLHLTPGMTGPWQVLGDTRVPLREMVSIDYLYAANWSLWTDAKVLVRTVGHMLAGRGL